VTTWCFHGCDRHSDLFGAVRTTLNLEPGDDHRASLSPVDRESTSHALGGTTTGHSTAVVALRVPYTAGRPSGRLSLRLRSVPFRHIHPRSWRTWEQVNDSLRPVGMNDCRPEWRKVGGSTPPLATASRLGRRCADLLPVDGLVSVRSAASRRKRGRPYRDRRSDQRQDRASAQRRPSSRSVPSAFGSASPSWRRRARQGSGGPAPSTSARRATRSGPISAASFATWRMAGTPAR